MQADAFHGRWTPVPDQGVAELTKSKRYHTLAVWLAMLRDATQNKTWITASTLEKLMRETGLSENTVLKAQAELVAAGYATVLSGGGKSHKTVTFALTPIASYTGRPAADTPGPRPIPTDEHWTI